MKINIVLFSWLEEVGLLKKQNVWNNFPFKDVLWLRHPEMWKMKGDLQVQTVWDMKESLDD